MTRTRFLRLSVLALLTLSACQPRPRVVNFDASTDIFRGLYRAEVDFRTASSVVAFSADGSRLATANGDGFHAAQLWDVAGGVPTRVADDEWYAQAVALRTSRRRPRGPSLTGRATKPSAPFPPSST